MTATNDSDAIHSIVESEIIRDLKAQLGRANALCRIRLDRIRELEEKTIKETDPGSAYQRGYMDGMAKGRRDAALDAPQSAIKKRLTREQWESIAHRTASRYSHRSDPQYIAYTFLPHTLEDFVSKLQDAIEGASSDHSARHP